MNKKQIMSIGATSTDINIELDPSRARLMEKDYLFKNPNNDRY
jgi:hypothetical protein